MIGSKLLPLLASISSTEFRRMRKVFQSPFFTTNERHLVLYELLRKYHPIFDTPKLVAVAAAPDRKRSALQTRAIKPTIRRIRGTHMGGVWSEFYICYRVTHFRLILQGVPTWFYTIFVFVVAFLAYCPDKHPGPRCYNFDLALR